MPTHHLLVRPALPSPTRTFVPLAIAGLALGVLSACAATRAAPQTTWLPDDTGWEVRDADTEEPPGWVRYERDAVAADVKEFRIVGTVDAEPEAVARALRHRLLDDAYLDDGLERTILRQTEDEVVMYGRTAVPFPFDDREVTERISFSHDPDTGVYTVLGENIEPGEPAPEGVLRIPVVRNAYTITPAGPGRSVITNDSLHDIGGAFPNWVIYSAVCDQLLEDLNTLRTLTAEEQGAPDAP